MQQISIAQCGQFFSPNPIEKVLFQLKKSPKLAYKVVDFRPATLPAKTQEEEQKHTQEYSEILAAAKRKEAKSTAVKEKLKKIQLQLEEQQAAAAKHFTQLVIPNWSQM